MGIGSLLLTSGASAIQADAKLWTSLLPSIAAAVRTGKAIGQSLGVVAELNEARKEGYGCQGEREGSLDSLLKYMVMIGEPGCEN
jgi:hypothetical protein